MRTSFVSLFGPEDLGLSILGLDVVVSRTFPVSRLLTVSPYVGGSSYLSYAREKSDVVNLDDEIVPGNQAILGAQFEISRARVALEVNSARVNTVSVKVGAVF